MTDSTAMAAQRESDPAGALESSASRQRAFIIVGVVAATVSAATAAYIFWSRARRLSPPIESVQQLLDRCHDQVSSIERRLTDLHPGLAA